MVAVASIEHELPAGVELAAVNGPALVHADRRRRRDRGQAAAACRSRTTRATRSRWREAFERAVGRIRARAPRIPFFSTVAGARVTDRGYWWRNLREPTRFDAALRRMTHLRAFVEIGPHPVLATLVPGAVAEHAAQAPAASSMFEAAALRAAGREPVALADPLRVAERGPAVDRALA